MDFKRRCFYFTTRIPLPANYSFPCNVSLQKVNPILCLAHTELNSIMKWKVYSPHLKKHATQPSHPSSPPLRQGNNFEILYNLPPFLHLTFHCRFKICMKKVSKFHLIFTICNSWIYNNNKWNRDNCLQMELFGTIN